MNQQKNKRKELEWSIKIQIDKYKYVLLKERVFLDDLTLSYAQQQQVPYFLQGKNTNDLLGRSLKQKCYLGKDANYQLLYMRYKT